MYLAKFFHRAPGDDDRELLLIPGGNPMIIGIHMQIEGAPEKDDFLREEYPSIEEAVATYRRLVTETAAAGYVETSHTDYTLRNLLPNPQAKLDWQKGLDDLMLAALSAPLDEQARHLAALKGTPAEHEPLYLWLAAHHGYAADTDNAQTIRFAEQARYTFAARRASKTSHYCWSIRESDLEARNCETLSWAQLRADNPAAALDAIDQAWKIAPSQDRGVQRATILCVHFPDRQEEAFDLAYSWHMHGGYEDIMALPAYAEYVARRKAKPKSDKGWRWATKKPDSTDDVQAAEKDLGMTLPRDYRKFLMAYGQTELQVRLPEHSGELCFYRASDLEKQRKNVFDFITMTDEDLSEVVPYFRSEYGVSLHHLVPVAQPAQESRCLLIHLEPGEKYGWCFQWDHDGAWELEHPTTSFDTALKELMAGIETRDTSMLSFLGVYID
jgi:hypothetical protein